MLRISKVYTILVLKHKQKHNENNSRIKKVFI